MLIRRIFGALAFRRTVFAEVRSDAGFTSTSWALVALFGTIPVVVFEPNTGELLRGGDAIGDLGMPIPVDIFIIAGYLLIVRPLSAIVGLTAASLATGGVARAVFKADVSFRELVRTMGLASVCFAWSIVGIGWLSVAAGLFTTPDWLLAVMSFPLGLPILAAMVVAAKEATDLGWGRTIVAVVVGTVTAIPCGTAAYWMMRCVLAAMSGAHILS
jgi:hypothetical protein